MQPANPIIKFATPDQAFIDLEFKNDLDYIQYVLYQSIYACYIHMFNHETTPLITEYIESVAYLVKTLKPQPSLYQSEKAIYDSIYYILTHGKPGTITWKTIDEALSYPCFNDQLKHMVPHRDFYLPLLSALGYGYPTDVYMEGKKPSACIYIPSLTIVPSAECRSQPINNQNPNRLHVSSENRKNILPYMTIVFDVITLPDYDFNLIRKLKNYQTNIKLDFFEYLSGFNFASQDLDAIFGILSTFGMEKGIYASINTVYNNLFSVISDTITGNNTMDGKLIPLPTHSLFKMLTVLKDYHRIGNLEDTRVFSIFVSKCEVDRDVSAYLAKPTNLITANEALAFRNSVISKFIVDKMLELPIYKKGTEAMEDTPPDDLGSDDLPPEEGEDPIPEDPDAAAFPDDNIPIGDGTPPPRDPVKLLLELASPEETFADVIYKKLVCSRIRNLLNNTPKDLPIKEVLLLKKWLTHWINLVSVNSIKDFLSRLSFRLNDLELTHKSI